ncbi:MAG: bifunctional nuclease family protein [Clostridia bacterium]|nr:bifunctional nuclease family protein [Clostridia bacterium]
MIPVRVKEIAFDFSMNPVLLLVDEEDSRVLPIWIGPFEAHSIAVALEGEIAVRPLTHDLLKTFCTECGATVTKAVITDVREGTYFAQLHIIHNDANSVIDARPSDAVALALRSVAPIYITPHVAEYTLTYDELFGEEQQEEMKRLITDVRSGKHSKSIH